MQGNSKAHAVCLANRLLGDYFRSAERKKLQIRLSTEKTAIFANGPIGTPCGCFASLLFCWELFCREFSLPLRALVTQYASALGDAVVWRSADP